MNTEPALSTMSLVLMLLLARLRGTSGWYPVDGVYRLSLLEAPDARRQTQAELLHLDVGYLGGDVVSELVD
jgi:hypothetical protein